MGVAAGMSYGVSLAYRKYEKVRNYGKYRNSGKSQNLRDLCCARLGTVTQSLETLILRFGLAATTELEYIRDHEQFLLGRRVAPIVESSMQWALKAKDFEFLDIDKPRIEFQKIASAFDVKSYRIETIKELDKAIPEAMSLVKSGKPVLIDLIMEKYTGAEPSTVP